MIRVPIFISIILLTYNLHAQNLIWEKDTLINDYLGTSLFPCLLDNDDNIVILIDEGSFNSYNYHFAKYSLGGELLNWKTYFENPPLCPMNFQETYNGYKAIAQSMETFDKLGLGLPKIVDFSKDGDTVNHFSPYNSSIDSIVSIYATKFMLIQYNKNTLFSNGIFFNVFIKDNIIINENTSFLSPHLIVQAYDTMGVILFRTGIDTVSSNGQYNFYDLKLSSDNNFVILAIKSPSTIDVSSAILQILKVNHAGKILAKYELPIKDRPFAPRSIAVLKNGDYVILGKDISSSNMMFAVLNSDGKFIKYVDIIKKNDGCDLFKLKLTPSGGLIALGKSYINNSNDYLIRNLIIYFDLELNEISNYQWYEHKKLQGSSGLRDIIFINECDFIGIGFKDNSKFYIARFALPTTSDIPGEFNNDMDLTPNPASEYIEIGFPDHTLKGVVEDHLEVGMFNILGERVLSDTPPYPLLIEGGLRLDVSGLPAGVYFVRIGNKVCKFVKM